MEEALKKSDSLSISTQEYQVISSIGISSGDSRNYYVTTPDFWLCTVSTVGLIGCVRVTTENQQFWTEKIGMYTSNMENVTLKTLLPGMGVTSLSRPKVKKYNERYGTDIFKSKEVYSQKSVSRLVGSTALGIAPAVQSLAMMLVSLPAAAAAMLLASEAFFRNCATFVQEFMTDEKGDSVVDCSVTSALSIPHMCVSSSKCNEFRASVNPKQEALNLPNGTVNLQKGDIIAAVLLRGTPYDQWSKMRDALKAGHATIAILRRSK